MSAAAAPRWAGALRALPANPMFRHFLRRDLRVSQLLMLAYVTLVFVGALAMLKMRFTSTPETVLLYGALRWGLGEFLWCWMAADHAFSTLGRARRQGRLRDWLLTPLGAQDIGGGFVASTVLLLAAGCVGAGVGEALFAYHPRLGNNLEALNIPWFAFGAGVLFPVAATASHLATCLWAAAHSSERALGAAPGALAWARTLASQGFRLAVVVAASLLATAMATIPLWQWALDAVRADSVPGAFSDLASARLHTAAVASLAVFTLLTIGSKLLMAAHRLRAVRGALAAEHLAEGPAENS
ncbi:MAG: hypothetical protein SF028_13820 [Candidatus Sumerlaeia bacterium]|nr:hypothetical protein [Candidatus Sumerlaeia bacterium]